MKASLAAITLVLGCTVFAQTTPKPMSASNPNLRMLVDEDQRVRTGRPLNKEERAKITRTDADRRIEVKRMIEANQLTTAEDYRNASLILQHGSTSDDYLLAHTLSVIAASKGDTQGLWLSAATLDRYLISIKQPQIYGTQYNHFDQTKPWTQEPYNETLVTDGLRKNLGVGSLSKQKTQLGEYNKPSTSK